MELVILIMLLFKLGCRFEERRNALANLIRITREGEQDIWTEHFKTILLLLLETLDDTDVSKSVWSLFVDCFDFVCLVCLRSWLKRGWSISTAFYSCSGRRLTESADYISCVSITLF